MSQPVEDSSRPALEVVFRRTFLWRLADPADAATLERLGDMLWQWVYETHQFGPGDGDPIRDGLAAAARDLQLLQGYLEELAAQRLEGGLSRERHLLAEQAEQAEQWGSTASMLAAEIAAAIAAQAPPPAP
jgi:hypothetical protein